MNDYRCPGLNALADRIAEWRKRKGFETNSGNVPVKLALLHSEVSEALEADRAGDGINFAEEMADTLIRVLDLTATLGIDIEREVAHKMAMNEQREFRHGKRY